MEVDELDVNPFYRQLQTTNFLLYEKAQKDCCVICVPQKSSLPSDTFSQKFTETHILRPSPYFTGQFLTSHISKSKTVMIEDKTLRTGDGFVKEIVVRILSEEVGYNKDYKPFKILVIDRPLDPRYQIQKKNFSAEVDLTIKVGFDECKTFLESFPAYSPLISSLDDQIFKFNSNYMLLSDYLDDAVERLEKLCSQTSEECIKVSSQKMLNEPQFSEVLCGAVQGYTLRKVHRKVFPAVCEKFAREDRQLLEKCTHLTGVTSDQLGVSKEFSWPLPAAISELAKLDGLKTPIEKLKCLKSTLDSITEGVDAHNREVKHPSMSNGEMSCLTSDDLIPILVTVLVQTKCAHILSNVFYMENFFWSGSLKDDLSYSLVTYKAAAEYTRSTDFSHIRPVNSSGKKDVANTNLTVNIDELMEATTRLSLPSGGTDNSGRTESPTASLSRIDRQLNRISKMLEVSTKTDKLPRQQPRSIFDSDPSSATSGANSTQRCQPSHDSRQKKQLGDFLSSLQDDIVNTSYGKQT